MGSRSPESRLAIVQFVSNVGELITRRPLATAGSIILTAVALHLGAIGHEAWSEADPDVERRAEELRVGHIIIGESPEHIARRSAVHRRHDSEMWIDAVGLAAGATLLFADFAIPPRRRNNLPLAVV